MNEFNTKHETLGSVQFTDPSGVWPASINWTNLKIRTSSCSPIFIMLQWLSDIMEETRWWDKPEEMSQSVGLGRPALVIFLARFYCFLSSFVSHCSAMLCCVRCYCFQCNRRSSRCYPFPVFCQFYWQQFWSWFCLPPYLPKNRSRSTSCLVLSYRSMCRSVDLALALDCMQ